MNENYARGVYYKENSHPSIRGKVVTDYTDDLHGEPAVRLAEKDTPSGTWYSYWQPTRQLDDEIELEAVEKGGTMDEEKLRAIEAKVKQKQFGTVEITP